MEEKNSRTVKIFVVFFILILLGFIFFFSIIYKIFTAKETLTLTATKADIATRGDIFSSDNFTLASSQKLYKVSLNTNSINPENAIYLSSFSVFTAALRPKRSPRKSKKAGISPCHMRLILTSLRILNNSILSYFPTMCFMNTRIKTAEFIKKWGCLWR